MASVPTQQSSTPVVMPSPRFDPEMLRVAFSMRWSILRRVPMSPPRDRQKMKSTGYCVFCMLSMATFIPKVMAQSPIAVLSTLTYFSLMPLWNKAPRALPIKMATALRMIANMLG